jgi:GNAT superfamily N-acetyltransferase
MTSVRPATASDVEGCVRVLDALPDYFTPDTHDALRTSLPLHRGWIAVDDGAPEDIVGFVAIEQRYLRAAEITFAAVRPERRAAGIGTALIERTLRDLTLDGVAVVEAKTLDASAAYEPYVATRAFWEARGFVQIDRIDPLPGWQPGNPAAIFVAALTLTI